MKNLADLKKEVLEDINREDAENIKRTIRELIDGIKERQKTIARATVDIADLQRVLKELENPQEITEEILG